MNKQEAIKLMETATDVNDWNRKREQVKQSIYNPAELQNVLGTIDGSGLITEVLGYDR